jgi:predicted 3-demethylubiquinone-9 3-methyltransferase (glyoxalase superfamily)
MARGDRSANLNDGICYHEAMRHITPHLWFDTQAKEAAEFYASAFPDAKVTHVSTLHDTPSGDSDIVSFEIAGQPFMAISAGPYSRSIRPYRSC